MCIVFIVVSRILKLEALLIRPWRTLSTVRIEGKSTPPVAKPDPSPNEKNNVFALVKGFMLQFVELHKTF